MLIVFIATAFGFAFVIRIRARAIADRIVATSTLTKIGTLASLLTAIGIVRFARVSFQAWAIAIAPAIVAIAFVEIERRRRESRFRSELYAFLNACILRMKSGEAFRPALEGAIEDADPRARPRLRELRDVVVFSQQGDGSARAKLDRALELAGRELAFADRDAHSSMRRCSALRDRVRMEDEFRRKSGQASRQARAQAFVLAGLYLAAFVFAASQFGLERNARVFAGSAATFAAGFAWTCAIGRKLKWKT